MTPVILWVRCLFAHKYHTIMKKLFIAATIVSALTDTASAATKAPDFRYPETVIQESTAQLDKATKGNDSQGVVDALVKLSLAKAKISADYLPELIATVDSAAQASGDNCRRSLLLAIEADIYAAIYDNNRYTINQRTELKDTTPDDVMEWSKKNFSDKIRSLSKAALAPKEELLKQPADDYKRIITEPKVGKEFMPTLYDILAHHFISTLSTFDMPSPMPLRLMNYTEFLSGKQVSGGSENDQYILSLYRSLLDANANNPAAFIYTELQRINYTNDGDHVYTYEKCVYDLYDKFADNKYSTEALLELRNKDINGAKLYEIAKRQVARFGDYERIAGLKNYITNYEKTTASVSLNECVASSDSIPLTITAANTSSVTVKAYAIPNDMKLEIDILKDLNKYQLVKTMVYDKLNMLQSHPQNQSVTNVKFPGLPYGKYLFMIECVDSKTGKTIMPSSLYRNSLTQVTDIDIASIRSGNENRIFAINTKTGKPIANAEIHIETDTDKWVSHRTNKDGYIVATDDECPADVYATSGKDRSTTEYIYNYGRFINKDTDVAADVMTDLAVYRPGDTVRFAAVVYESDNKGHRKYPLRNRSVSATIFDASGKEVSKMQLRTDDYGRIDSTAVLPTAGITGQFRISIKDISGNRGIGIKYFQVSEYKAPTFYIEYNKELTKTSEAGETLLHGKVMTYSQFPIANANVVYNILQRTFPFYDTPEEIASGTVTTDAEGNWTITVQKDDNDADGKWFKWYELSITATSANGESQSLETSVKLGNRLQVSFDQSELKAEATKATKVAFSVEELSSGKETSTDCEYSIVTANQDTIASGTVNSAKPEFDFSGIASGKYTLWVKIPGSEEESKDDIELTLYRKSDKVPPIETPIWITSEDVKCDADGNFSFKLGSSYDTHIYATLYNADEVITENWLSHKKGIREFKGKAKFTNLGETLVTLFAVHDHKFYTETVKLIPATPRDSMKIVTETFRDNITPGSKETWKLRLSGNNGQKYVGAMIANMYDAALNAIARNTYFLYLNDNFSYPHSYYNPYYNSYTNFAYAPTKPESETVYTIPYINYYGERFLRYPLAFHSTRLLRKEASPLLMESASTMDSNALEETVIMAYGRTSKDEVGDNDEATGSGTAYRDPDVKTAFFLPSLVSDEDGVVTLQFDVPNRNTQWQFTAVAYDSEMHADFINRIVTANKQLMVQPNLPRFIRTGDVATLKSTVMNNSGKPVDAYATIEIFDPETMTVIATEKQNLHIEANGSAVVETSITATDKYSMMGYRIKAESAEFADGEQNAIAVLPATTDVVEATPFYLKEKQQEATLTLPKFNKEGKITVEYCDNPIWYCAISLPSVISDSQTSSALASNYYVTSVSDRIVNGNTTVASALKHFAETKELKSNLQKNSELKTIELANTPWVSKAESETEMMSKLVDLTDAATIQYRKQKSLTSLSDLQNSDGGFAWLKGAKSSEYATWDVLRLFGYLNEAGYSDKNDALANQIIDKAIGYADSQLIETLKKAKKPRDMYSFYIHYIYIRSLFPDKEMPKEIADVKKNVIAETKKAWGKYSIERKAQAAIMLANYGETKEAAKIVESLRQYARKDSKGYYWDVENTDRVALASMALKAFYKVNPSDADIDNIRRWILISKETTKWIYSPAACDAINAVLACGSDWTAEASKSPEISVGGIKIDTDTATQYFGYVKQEIDPDKLNGQDFRVKRNGANPAWGAVYCQYNAPMNEVAKASSSDIKIEKQFYRYDAGGKLESTSTSKLKVGDKLQVRITIKTGRDLSFVALTDQRPAAFEPVDQLPTYEWKERSLYLRETRDASTNVFFTFIDKGTRVITYDVYVNNAGTFSNGIASLQCQYAPQIVAHSNGTMITAE